MFGRNLLLIYVDEINFSFSPAIYMFIKQQIWRAGDRWNYVVRVHTFNSAFGKIEFFKLKLILKWFIENTLIMQFTLLFVFLNISDCIIEY